MGESVNRKGMVLTGIERILIMAPNWIGDAVLALPAVASVAKGFPGARIDVLARGEVADIFLGQDAVSAIRRVDRSDLRGIGLLRTASALRDEKYQAAVLFPNSFRSALLAWLARIPVRIGYGRDIRGLFLSKAVPPGPKGRRVHQSEYYLDLPRAIGISAEMSIPVLRLSEDEVDRARSFISEHGAEHGAKHGLNASNLVGLAPGAAYGAAKKWGSDRFAEAAARLAGEFGAGVVVFGAEREREDGEAIRRRLPAALNLAGRTTVREFMALVSLCRVLLTNDSGAMHAAVATGVPVVAVFGPTDPGETAPLGEGHAVVREPVECSPCFRRECPTDHRCMTRIAVERVVEAAERVLAKERQKEAAEVRG
ncbi:MAG: lipopolysaccharide heptosyltransferase II [Nitrospirae bacterium RBG_16_64_22]|nr:MAG: lipopolysaccharide heptosyltransferase II [Nitrospirae bacterium RBG_16_64_22]